MRVGRVKKNILWGEGRVPVMFGLRQVMGFINVRWLAACDQEKESGEQQHLHKEPNGGFPSFRLWQVANYHFYLVAPFGDTKFEISSKSRFSDWYNL